MSLKDISIIALSILIILYGYNNYKMKSDLKSIFRWQSYFVVKNKKLLYKTTGLAQIFVGLNTILVFLVMDMKEPKRLLALLGIVFMAVNVWYWIQMLRAVRIRYKKKEKGGCCAKND